MKHKDNRTDDLARLCSADARVIDEMLELMAKEPSLKLSGAGSAVDTDALPHDENLDQRARKISQVMSLIQQYPVSPVPDDLLQRTLTHINEAKQQKRFTQQITALKAPRPGYWWSRELVSVAAVLMIAVSLLWPALDRVRDKFRLNADTHETPLTSKLLGRLPQGKHPRQNNLWWNVSQALNSNDYPLSTASTAKQKNKKNESLLKGRFGSRVAKAYPNTSPRYRMQHSASVIVFDRRHCVAILTGRPPSFVKRPDYDTATACYWGITPDQHNMQALHSTSDMTTHSKRHASSAGNNVWLNRVINNNKNTTLPLLTTEDPFFVSVSNQE